MIKAVVLPEDDDEDEDWSAPPVVLLKPDAEAAAEVTVIPSKAVLELKAAKTPALAAVLLLYAPPETTRSISKEPPLNWIKCINL